jgi:hypothetical protein
MPSSLRALAGPEFGMHQHDQPDKRKGEEAHGLAGALDLAGATGTGVAVGAGQPAHQRPMRAL